MRKSRRIDLERCRRHLRESEARVETLLAFTPDRDVAMVFDAGNVRDEVRTRDTTAIAEGRMSARHASHRVVVSRFARRSAEPPRSEVQNKLPQPPQPTAVPVDEDPSTSLVSTASLLEGSMAELAASRAAHALESEAVRLTVQKDRAASSDRCHSLANEVSKRDAMLRELTNAVVQARATVGR